MNSLLLKLILTPSVIGAASLAGRRWGHSVSGWLVALPLTTGPITFFLALTHGASFAAAASAGTLAGGFSQAAFALTYAWSSLHWRWLPALSAACLAFAGVTAVLERFSLPLLLLYPGVLLAFFIALRLLPRTAAPEALSETLPWRWDLPLRMTLATAFVLLITGLAPALGPHLTGLLAPFPLFTSILAAFAHQQHGPSAAITLLRGLLMGLFSFVSFFFVLGLLLKRVGIPAAFLAAILVVFVLQGISLWHLQRRLG